MGNLNDFKSIVYSAVLIPNTPDYDGDILTEEQIRVKMYDFMRSSQLTDLQHSFNPVKSTIIENYILPFDYEVEILGEKKILPKGSWIMALEIEDEQVREQVKKGEIKGFSISAFSSIGGTSNKSENKQEERTTLADLGEDFVITSVSLVENPAVYDAKFFAFKSAPKKERETILSVIKSIFAKKGDENQMNEEQLKEFIKQTVIEAVNEIKEELTSEPNMEEIEEVDKSTETKTEEVKEEVKTEDKEEVDEEKENLKKEIEELKSKLAVKSTKSEVLEQFTVKSNVVETKSKRDAFGRLV